MQLKLDVKTLVIGITLGFIITLVIGAGSRSADWADFGIAVESKGAALVKTSNGSLYVVNPEEGMAIRVLHAKNLSTDFEDARNAKGILFSLSSSGRSEKTSTRY